MTFIAPTAALAPPAPSRGSRWRGNPWVQFAVRRATGVLFSLAVLVLMTFMIVPLIPGDPAIAILGTNANPAAIADVRSRLNLDDPLWHQLFSYVGRLLSGDLGESFRYQTPVSTTIASKLPYTATIAFGAILVVLVVSIPLGMIVGVLTRGGRRPATGTVFGAVAGVFASFPSYVAGTLLVVVFAIWLRVLPAGGSTEQGSFVLPIAALALGPTFAVARVVRQETLTVLEQDFMRTARGRRLTAVRLYIKHALPNLMASTLTLSGLILAAMLGGAVIIEQVFAIPGLGTEVIQAIIARDYPVIQGIVLVIGLIAIAVNLAIDVVLAIIDPRTLGSRSHV